MKKQSLRGKPTAIRSFCKRRNLPGAAALRGLVAISGDRSRCASRASPKTRQSLMEPYSAKQLRKNRAIRCSLVVTLLILYSLASVSTVGTECLVINTHFIIASTNGLGNDKSIHRITNLGCLPIRVSCAQPLQTLLCFIRVLKGVA